MATLSPSKPRTLPGYGPTPVQQERSSPQRAAFVPRSALPEPGSQSPSPTSPSSTSLLAAQAIQAFNSDGVHDGAFLLSTEDLGQDFRHDAVSEINVSARNGRGSDEETVQGSSEASVDIITERDTIAYSDVRSASPRKPLPAQWLPSSNSPTLTTTQRMRVHGDTMASSSGSPIDRRAIRITRSSIDFGKAHADTTSFLTKEALDAVDANITSPTLRRSPSKIQRSPTKVPWNSPAVSPKVGTLRHSGASPTKPSPPRVTHLGAHVTVDHRRAPSSIISTGATSFHTAHGSPVRSSACSQSSFSSAEDLDDSVSFHYADYVADLDVEQVNDLNSRGTTASTAAAKASLRSRTSRPELSIRIPPSDASVDAEQRSASTIASATSSTAVSIEEVENSGIGLLENHHGTATQSRIPRMSISKGSSARAPTLSSTLKQTKSTQTLRSPKAIKGKPEPKSTTYSKTTRTKSQHHVRTIDSTGSTPILSNHKSRDFGLPASVACVAKTNTERATRARDVDLLTSYLQDTALQAAEPAESLPGTNTTSRATSSSTVKASRVTEDPVISSSADVQTRKRPDSLVGNIHSSDADDEYDDFSIIAPVRGRSAQYHPVTRRTTISEVSMQSSSASDLRATATEFVPTLKDTFENVSDPQQPPSLPDMYALDGYGIPWFYHMYPVPWMFPPMYGKGRSKSPKKFRPTKQRPTMTAPMADQKERLEAFNSAQTENAASITNSTTSAPDTPRGSDAAPYRQILAAAPDNIPVTCTTPHVKASDGSFSIQLDMIAHQTALHPKMNITHPPVDLTSIRNVPAQVDYLQGHAQGYSTLPSRRRNQRQVGNGLYGGRGNVGMPIYATAPFPTPVPPMGRPVQNSGGSHDPYAGYTVGTQGCGTVEIEKAAEYGGGQPCNTCEPDH